MCIICHESFDDLNLICILPCGHFYHRDCILQWHRACTSDGIRRFADCPDCRSGFQLGRSSHAIQKVFSMGVRLVKSDGEEALSIEEDHKNAEAQKTIANLTTECSNLRSQLVNTKATVEAKQEEVSRLRGQLLAKEKIAEEEKRRVQYLRDKESQLMKQNKELKSQLETIKEIQTGFQISNDENLERLRINTEAFEKLQSQFLEAEQEADELRKWADLRVAENKRVLMKSFEKEMTELQRNWESKYSICKSDLKKKKTELKKMRKEIESVVASFVGWRPPILTASQDSQTSPINISVDAECQVSNLDLSIFKDVRLNGGIHEKSLGLEVPQDRDLSHLCRDELAGAAGGSFISPLVPSIQQTAQVPSCLLAYGFEAFIDPKMNFGRGWRKYRS